MDYMPIYYLSLRPWMGRTFLLYSITDTIQIPEIPFVYFSNNS